MPARMGKYRDKKNSKDQNQNIRRNFFKKDVNSNKSEGSFTDCDIRESMKQKPNSSFAKSNKTATSSSALATLAQAARQDKWIEYDVTVEKEELNMNCNVKENSITKEEKLTYWLENNKPSRILRSRGVGWICLTVSPPPPDPHRKASELQEAWDSLTSQKDEITITDVRELATKFSVTGGKWLLHVNSFEVDKVWFIVATAAHAGHLGPNVYRAKVSPVSDVDDVNNEHVIQVYNKDFTDEEEVEASLRQADLRYVLQYKPQIFSALGIYRNNRLGLRPSIYQSQYEMNEERPVIESVLEKSWFWNNAQGCGSDEGIGNDLGLSKKDDRIIRRPCNYYNDVGMCEFSSGHLSKSGFTERMHLCRYCFNVKGREEFHSELRCHEKSRTEQNERNHPETKCDRRRNVNKESLLSVINSLNQMKVAESRNSEGKLYDSRDGFPQIQNGRKNGNNWKGGVNASRNGCLANSGGVYGGACKNYGKENAMPQASKEKRNTGTRDIGGRRSEKIRCELDQSTPRSRLYQNISYGKEKEPQNRKCEMIPKDKEELGNLGKEQEKDKSSKDASNVEDEDEMKRKMEKNELHESKKQRKKLGKKEDSLNDKKRMDEDVNKSKSNKNDKQDKPETIGKKESHSKGKKDKKNKGKVKFTVNASADSNRISTTDAKYEDILDAKMSTKECSNKGESNSTENKAGAKNQSKEDSSNISTIEEKSPMPNIETPNKPKENEKLSEEKKATDFTSLQTKDKKLKDIKSQEMNPGKLIPGGQTNAKSTAPKYDSPRSTNEKGFQTPPRFEKLRNRTGFAESNFSERFPNPPTFVENELPKSPTIAEKKFSNPPPFVEKFSKPPPFVEKKFPSAPRFFERKFPVAPRFAEKFPSGPKFEKGFHNPTDYSKKTPNFVKSTRNVSSTKNQGKERKPTHCPCPPYCTACLAIVKKLN